MCGISGFVGRFDQDLLSRMSGVMAHRGPDDAGIYFKENTGLAHRRLSIIDLAGGHQPISNEDDTVWIIFNGEVYNFMSLRKKYLNTHKFKTRSDTEVILHMYEEFGEGLVNYLRGMFAFAIWDENKQKLLVVRDRFGIKPLYYAETEKGLLFASEMKAILETGAVDREVDKQALNSYLTFRYVPGSRTMIAGIKKLEPGHLCTFQENKLTISQYWDLDFNKEENRSEAYYADKLTDLLKESIDIRLISEVPLGAYLSGGLDSSFMIGLMSQLVDQPVKTFTAGFQGGWHDESPYAAIIAEKFKTDHHPLKTDADAVAILEKVIWHLDEPLADAATIPTYLLSQLTRKYVTVVLSGEGSDELLAGYDKYKMMLYRQNMAPFLFTPLFSALGHLFSANIKFQRGFEFLGSKENLAQTFLGMSAVFTTAEKKRLLGPELRELNGYEDEAAILATKCLDPEEKGGDLLDRLMYLDVKTWLPNDVLLKNDKMTMAHSLEARVPFLDHKFAEFLMTIPSRLKLKRFSEKHILRRAMQGLVPNEIIKRKKHGFTVPIAEWMQNGLKGYVAELINEKSISKSGHWDYAYLKNLMRQDLNNAFYRRQFWAIVTFEIWHRIFIQNRLIKV